MRFVIVTGMSGAGKSTALKMLEDMGYFCVDNLPIPLLPGFVQMLQNTDTEMKKVALGLDMEQLPEDLSTLCCSCQQKLLEISLCDHGDLRELPVIQSQKFRDCPGDFFRFRYRLAFIRVHQRGIGFSYRITRSPLFSCQIFRISYHLIRFSTPREKKLHIRFYLFRSILTAEHG